MAVYEFTLVYPDRDYDEHRRFLASVAASPPSGLDGFRRHGGGVALTFVVEGDFDAVTAGTIARQRAAGLWPYFRPDSTTLEVRGGPVRP